MQEQGFITYSGVNAKIGAMNKQRPKLGEKTEAVGRLIEWQPECLALKS